MNIAGSGNTTISLYSNPTDYQSHQVRIVCYEKDVNVKIIDCFEEDTPEIVRFNNPYNSLPTLVDRELVLYDSDIIIDYLEERFPHPPLYSVFPTVRAQTRMALLRIRKEWIDPMYKIIYAEHHGLSKNDVNKIRTELHDNILSTASVFKETEFFMNNTFGILDCFVIPLLWRLHELEINFSSKLAKPIVEYMRKMFVRESFLKSCSKQERLFMKGIKV